MAPTAPPTLPRLKHIRWGGKEGGKVGGWYRSEEEEERTSLLVFVLLKKTHSVYPGRISKASLVFIDTCVFSFFIVVHLVHGVCFDCFEKHLGLGTGSFGVVLQVLFLQGRQFKTVLTQPFVFAR